MQGYEPETYGERIADLYDDWSPGILETDACVERLAALAGPGPVLELGVGTGRLALPLAERGLEVHGVDCSPAMLARLAAKPGGERVRTMLNDFTDLALDSVFTLVVVAADTLFLLPDQDAQVRCFQSIAKHLTGDGALVHEGFIPGNTRYAAGQDVVVRRVTADSVVLGTALHDPVRQRLTAQQIMVTAEGIRMVPGVLRYAWPSELDLMARLAGLRLRERWGGWRDEAFTAASARAISVYTPA